MKAVSFFFLIPVLFSACGTPTNWKPEERLFVDRGLTLPKDVRAWKTLVVFGLDEENGRSQDSSHYLYPFTWEQGLSDRWTVVWSPFPLDLKYRAYQLLDQADPAGGRTQFDLQFSFLGNGYSNAKTFLWRPAVSGLLKKSYEKKWGWELKTFFQPELGRSLAENFALTLGLEAGSLWQISDRMGVKLLLAAQGEMKGPGSQYLKNAPSEFSRDLVWRFPVGVVFHGAIHSEWDFQAEYRWYRIGYLSGFEAHQWIMTTMMYW